MASKNLVILEYLLTHQQTRSKMVPQQAVEPASSRSANSPTPPASCQDVLMRSNRRRNGFQVDPSSQAGFNVSGQCPSTRRITVAVAEKGTDNLIPATIQHYELDVSQA
jgi:hypothetical protein